ncbi:MAG: DUF1553 domain-containing protein [Planctomycetales bacterium]|nr:DUF1553 domain-containing protein [Planctomycetales bacterium]
MRPSARNIIFFAAIATFWLCRETRADDARQRELFESKIRPVLVEQCYSCHSSQAKELKGGLSVETAEALRRGGDSGPALTPGKPAESLLLEALKYDGLEMPPSGRLNDQVVADFETWIRDGAWDPRTGSAAPAAKPSTIDIEAGKQHWAFQPVQRHRPPATKRTDWATTSIDPFVLAKLEELGLAPATDADVETLVRRLHVDLTGLPPTPEQWRADVAALNADFETAYVELVDRLLQSDQFGVHWGRHWLDIARYADSNGGDFNATFHNAWRYRNYVVDSLNADKPYDRFVREQIAGDLLPAADDRQRTEQLVATGFLMLGTKMLSERDKEKLTMDVADEQINTIGASLLGMTLGCARCHDHKFDPIPTRDYYALAGIFLSTRTLHGESQKYVSTWQRVNLPAAPEHVEAVQSHARQQKQLDEKIKQLKQKLQVAERQLAAAGDSLLADDQSAVVRGNWTKSTFKSPFVGVGYLHDHREGKGDKSVTFTLKPRQAGRYQVQLAFTPHADHAAKAPVDLRAGELQQRVLVNQTRKPSIDGQYEAIAEVELQADAPLEVTVSNEGTQGYVIVDAVRLRRIGADAATGAKADANDADDTDDEAGTAAREAKREVEQLKQALTKAEDELKQHKTAAPKPLPQAFAVAEMPEIVDCELCIRGQHRVRGDKIPRGFLSVLPASATFDNQSSGRLQLAEWLTNPSHPLTSRVIVNRVWRHMFGEGLVRTVDNFGALGDRPSHPELLDELAGRFTAPAADGGWAWSLKSLIRELALSRVYRLSSQHDESSWQRDPENQLLWRANRRRLTAESIRDAMLSCAGTLDLTPGGSPVPGLGTLVTTNSADAEQYEGTRSASRSIYLPIIRNELPVSLAAFDFADPDLVVGRRAETNVPAQALLLLNSPEVMEAAKQAAARIAVRAQYDPAKETSTAAERGKMLRRLVVEAYETTLNRTPSPAEQSRDAKFLARIGDGGPPSEKTDTLQELARLVHVLMASTEFRLLE